MAHLENQFIVHLQHQASGRQRRRRQPIAAVLLFTDGCACGLAVRGASLATFHPPTARTTQRAARLDGKHAAMARYSKVPLVGRKSSGGKLSATFPSACASAHWGGTDKPQPRTATNLHNRSVHEI